MRLFSLVAVASKTKFWRQVANFCSSAPCYQLRVCFRMELSICLKEVCVKRKLTTYNKEAEFWIQNIERFIYLLSGIFFYLCNFFLEIMPLVF